MKDAKNNGVPRGTRWENIELWKFTHPRDMKPIQKGKEILKVIDMWLVEVKIYGNKPIKLLIKI